MTTVRSLFKKRPKWITAEILFIVTYMGVPSFLNFKGKYIAFSHNDLREWDWVGELTDFPHRSGLFVVRVKVGPVRNIGTSAGSSVYRPSPTFKMIGHVTEGSLLDLINHDVLHETRKVKNLTMQCRTSQS